MFPFESALVTGSEGMVGSRLVEMLAERGAKRIVCLDILPRSASKFDLRAKRLSSAYGTVTEYVNCDISDENAVKSCGAFDGVGVVFHIAALVGPFFPHRLYKKVNYEGTKNVLGAFRSHGTCSPAGKCPVFVDCSSPSTRFDGQNIEGKMEHELPYCFSGHEYARTKALAESFVLESNGSGIATCAVAPHQVYGTEDALFLPALLETAKSGRLRVFGSGSNAVSFTHTDNIVHGLIIAAAKLWKEGSTSLAAGEFFVVTDGGARPIWDAIDDAVVRAGYPSIFDKLPVPKIVLYAVAYAGTIFHYMTGNFLKLTPFTVNMMTIDRVFCTAKARCVLGYRPIRSFDDAWPEAIDAISRRQQ